MMVLFCQKVNLSVKISHKTGDNYSTSGLQSNFEADGNDGRVLIANDGSK